MRRQNPGTLLGRLMKKFPEGLLNRLQMSLGGHTLPCHNLNQGRMRQAGTGPVGEGLVSLLCSDYVPHHPEVEFKHAVGLQGPDLGVSCRKLTSSKESQGLSQQLPVSGSKEKETTLPMNEEEAGGR